MAAVASERLSRSFLDVDIETNVGNGRLLAYLAAHGEILSQRYGEDRVTLHCRIPQQYLAKMPHDDAEVRTHVRPAVGGNGHVGNGHAGPTAAFDEVVPVDGAPLDERSMGDVA